MGSGTSEALKLDQSMLRVEINWDSVPTAACGRATDEANFYHFSPPLFCMNGWGSATLSFSPLSGVQSKEYK